MKRTLASVAPLLVGVAILLTGQGLQGTLLPVRASMEGFSTLAIGLMGGAPGSVAAGMVVRPRSISMRKSCEMVICA